MEDDEISLSTIELRMQVQPLEVDITHFGSGSEIAIYTQFANQHSRFSVFKHNSRFIWKFLGKGRMLVIDSFMNVESIFRILSADSNQTPISVICFEQTSEKSGFVVFVDDNEYYIATAYLNVDHGLLQVDTNKTFLIDNKNHYSMASVNWSSTHKIGFVMLGQITFGCANTFFFRLNSCDEFEMLFSGFYRPPVLMQNASPLIFDDSSRIMMVRTENRDRWIIYELDERNQINEKMERQSLGHGTDNIGSRFTSIWIADKQNLYIESPLDINPTSPAGFTRLRFSALRPKKYYRLKLYDQETKQIRGIKLPCSVYSLLNESLNSSICMAWDGIMLICSESKDKKKLIVQRVPIRSPELLYNLTVIMYRQSRNSQKLPDQLLGMRSFS